VIENGARQLGMNERESSKAGADVSSRPSAMNAKGRQGGEGMANREGDVKKWLADVKRIDDTMQAERCKFEEITKISRENGRQGNPLGEPSNRVNTLQTPATRVPNATGKLPKLTDTERRLLFDNEGCLKCRKFFVAHKSVNCPNGWPTASGYRTLTQADVDRARNGGKGKGVAAAVNVGENDVPAHPVAVVMGSTKEPAAYMPANMSSVIERGNESISENSVSTSASVPLYTPVPDIKGNITLTANDPPFYSPHFLWKCEVASRGDALLLMVESLIDNGSQPVLIESALTTSLGLKCRKLYKPHKIRLAMMAEGGGREEIALTEWVKLKVSDPSHLWTTRSVCTIVVPTLCSPILLGLPFLVRNNIVIDHAARTVIDKVLQFDLVNPQPRAAPPPPKPKLRDIFKKITANHELMKKELKAVCAERKVTVDSRIEIVKKPDIVAAVRECLEVLAAQEKLIKLGKQIKAEFADVFEPIPHVDRLPSDVQCQIKLKDATQTITTRTYSSPRKYRDAWSTLIQQHLDAGRIRLSNSANASPAFLIPKADHAELPCWVNDYRILNGNTVTDSHPLP
jgi:hypothetical protein